MAILQRPFELFTFDEERVFLKLETEHLKLKIGNFENSHFGKMILVDEKFITSKLSHA